MTAARVLVVEDDRTTADLVALYLRHAGHQVVVEHSGDRALVRLEQERFDLLILDVMLPGADGLSICRAVRKVAGTPVILLTARDREEERVAGLELGADDFVPKPFSPRELVARVGAVLRRVPPGTHETLGRGALLIDLLKREVMLRGELVEVTPSEFVILLALARRPGRVLSRSQLLDELPGSSTQALDRTIDVHIRNLRRKLELNPAAPEMIQTVIGAGYRFAEPPRTST